MRAVMSLKPAFVARHSLAFWGVVACAFGAASACSSDDSTSGSQATGGQTQTTGGANGTGGDTTPTGGATSGGTGGTPSGGATSGGTGGTDGTGSTTSGRVKEEAEDYRYFPEPDLVPVAPSREWVEEIRSALPELPLVRRTRLLEEWGISATDMQAIVNAGALDPIVATIKVTLQKISESRAKAAELAPAPPIRNRRRRRT